MIPATEFKTHCLRIIAEVNATGEPVTITKHGKPVAEVKPVRVQTPHASLIGMLKRTGYRFDGRAGPVHDTPWNAELGILEADE